MLKFQKDMKKQKKPKVQINIPLSGNKLLKNVLNSVNKNDEIKAHIEGEKEKKLVKEITV